MLKAAGIHRKRVSSAQLIDICRTFVYPVADYAMHLMPINTTDGCSLSSALELLDYQVIEFAIGCIEKVPARRRVRSIRIGGRLPRFLKLAKLPDWTQRIRLRLQSLRKRLRKRAQLRCSDPMARHDCLKFTRFRSESLSPKDMTRDQLRTVWKALCRRNRRSIPVPRAGPVPILTETDTTIRDAGIRWYAGSFPGMSSDIKAKIGTADYEEAKQAIDKGLRMEQWNQKTRNRTIESLRVFLSAREEGTSSNVRPRSRGVKRKASGTTVPLRSIRRKTCRSRCLNSS